MKEVYRDRHGLRWLIDASQDAGTLSESLLFGVTGGDPATYGFAIAAMIAAAAGAVWFPARRAAVVDPIVALRCE
jgi:hypothetical protein